ncbi:MAG: sulfotransferase [Bacteroidota bacterium]
MPTQPVLSIPQNLRLPNFVIIGAQKGGTTWLQSVLHKHPQIHIPPAPRESHFFNRDASRFDWYANLFNREDSIGKVLGEKSPNYFDMSEERIQYMHRVLPNAKLIVILREPVARAWSHARMERSNYQHRKLNAEDLNKVLLHIGSIRNINRTNYAEILKRWFRYYQRDQIFIGFYHDLKTDNLAFLKKIYDFIGVDPYFPEDATKKVYSGHKLDIPEEAKWYLQRKYKSLSSRLARLNIEAPETWLENEVRLPFWKKVKVWSWIEPRNIVFNLVYKIYKNRKERSMPIPIVKIVK